MLQFLDNSWQLFIFSNYTGFNLAAPDLYFTILSEVFINRILAKKMYFTSHIEWTEYNHSLKTGLASKYQIILHWHKCFFYKQHFYMQCQPEIGKKIKLTLSNTLRLNLGYWKIIHILHPHYHPKIIGHTLKISKRTSVSVFMRFTINHNENEDEKEK